MSSDDERNNGNGSRRKLRVLVITMGGNRKKQIENLFSDKDMSSTFESPTFSDGVLSRSLRNRYHFFRIANEAGLLPENEWIAIRNAYEQNNISNDEQNKNKQETFFDCLQGIESNTTKERKGSEQDIKLHYSVELWRKSKSINRGRSVLACIFAHLIALKKLVDSSSSSSSSFDLIVEDNIRLDPINCAKKVWDAVNACEEWEKENNNNVCHLRFIGWLGSNTNLEWIMETHIPKRKYVMMEDYNDQDRDLDRDDCDDCDDCDGTIAPFPLHEHLEEDLSVMMDGVSLNSATTTTREKNDVDRIEEEEDEKSDTKNNETHQHTHNKPGGNLCWGAYAYWMSNEGYESLMKTLRNDVGAILWKGKRQRHYTVKPIDKILPRQTISNFGSSAVQISSQPAFFRAPMLTSKIHSKWDPGFGDATEYQLQANNLDWSNLWLTDIEREIVSHHKISGKWITEMELQSSRDDASA